jgi:hypothetical protein
MPRVLKRGVFGFGSFAGFKWGFPSCLRGPLGLSPTEMVSLKLLCFSVADDELIDTWLSVRGL